MLSLISEIETCIFSSNCNTESKSKCWLENILHSRVAACMLFSLTRSDDSKTKFGNKVTCPLPIEQNLSTKKSFNIAQNCLFYFKNFTLKKFSCISVWFLRIWTFCSSMLFSIVLKSLHSVVFVWSCWRRSLMVSSWRQSPWTQLASGGLFTTGTDLTLLESRADFHSKARFFWAAKNCS